MKRCPHCFSEHFIPEIQYILEAEVVFGCPIDYTHFPFHSATCKLRITSFNERNSSIVFRNKPWDADRMLDPSAKIIGYSFGISYLKGQDTVQRSWANRSWFSVVGLKIELVGKYGKYISLYFIPTTMFTITSWVSHLLPPTSYPARTSLLVTTFLCQVGIFTSAQKDNPYHDEGLILWHDLIAR